MVKIITNRRVLYIFWTITPQLVKFTYNKVLCVFQLMHWHNRQFSQSMVYYSSKANNWEKISFMCYCKQGVNGPYFTHFTMLKFFLSMRCPLWWILQCLALSYHVFVVTYKTMCFFLVKITINVTFWVHLWTLKPHTSLKSPKIYFYMSILLNCIDITIHYKTPHRRL